MAEDGTVGDWMRLSKHSETISALKLKHATEIEQLRARLAEAESERARSDRQYVEMVGHAAEMEGLKDKAEAQLAEARREVLELRTQRNLAQSFADAAREDSRRLEFLVVKQAIISVDRRIPTYFVLWEDEDGCEQEFRDTNFRAAIDAARGEG